jgi:predicted ATP-binding protein involved in virulence
MKIERLILENFRGIGKTLELPLEPDLTVLAGVNGSGKSSILDALAILLSWVVARIRRAGGSGQPISELSIRNSAGYARIRAEARFPENLSWQLVKTKKGHVQSAYATELEALSRHAKSIQQQISETQGKCDIPLFAYYPVNRSVLDIPLRIRKLHEFDLLEVWDESLVGAANFRRFFEWFRNREDLENEERIWAWLEKTQGKAKKELSQQAIEIIERFKKTWVEKRVSKEDFSLDGHQLEERAFKEFWIVDSQLEAVRNALKIFLPRFTDLSVRRNPLRMTVRKGDKELRVDQLSDGEKCLMALVGDLARRLAIANPGRENPLEGEGVVLIDEIDLHIHPGWQRTILANLIKAFPGCQFVVSTHSPQVLGETEGRQVRLLAQDEENKFSYSIPRQAKGLSSNEILDELMRPDGTTLARDSETQQQLDKLFELIDRDKFQEAKKLIADMRQQLHGDIPDLVRAESLLFMLNADGE